MSTQDPIATPAAADDGLPHVGFPTGADWERWLETNHGRSPGVWIRIAKNHSEIASVRYPEVLDIALCFGWIDSRREALDETYFLQRFTPRRPRSHWSRINREKVERLDAEQRMRPSGLDEVARAKADGRWQAACRGRGLPTRPSPIDERSGHATRHRAS